MWNNEKECNLCNLKCLLYCIKNNCCFIDCIADGKTTSPVRSLFVVEAIPSIISPPSSLVVYDLVDCGAYNRNCFVISVIIKKNEKKVR